jgi:hypothetical protein
MFPKLEPNREIRLLVDLLSYNIIMVQDHEPIPNQALISRTSGIAKYCLTINLEDWYFQIRVKPEYKKYNIIKTPFKSFVCKVMLCYKGIPMY